MKRILLFILMLTSLSIFAQSDVHINPNQSFCGESNLVVNQANGLLVASWMKVTSINPIIISIAVSQSTDGGQNWSTPVYMPHFYKTGTSADPALAYNKNGELFLIYIDSKIIKDSGDVYCCKSSDDGKSWSKPVKVIDYHFAPDIPIDRPFIAIDKSGGTHNNRIYITSKSYSAGARPHHIWLTFSDDKGLSWHQPQMIDTLAVPLDLKSDVPGYPAVTSNGKLLIMYPSYNIKFSPYPRYILLESYDGINFKFDPVLVLNASSGGVAADSLLQGSITFAANPNDSLNYVLSWTDRRNGDLDIYSSNTADGKSWSVPKRINDDALSNSNQQDMCWSGFSAGGHYGIAWRDRRNNTLVQTSDYDIYSTVSTDGGNNFGTNIKLSQTSGALFIPIDGNDFIGFDLNDSNIYCTWADKRNGKNQLYFNSNNYIRKNNVASIKEASKDLINIYPNPAQDEINIVIADGRSGMVIELLSMNGQLICRKSVKGNSLTIPCKEYPRGAYLIKSYRPSNSGAAMDLIESRSIILE